MCILTFVSLPSFAYPFLVYLESQDFEGMMLQGVKHKFIPIPAGTGVEFVALRPTEWQLSFGGKNIKLDDLLRLCETNAKKETATLSVCYFRLVQAENGFFGMQRHPVVDTFIPLSTFTALLSVFYNQEPSLYFAPATLTEVKNIDPWLEANLATLKALFAKVLAQVASPLMLKIRNYLEQKTKAPANNFTGSRVLAPNALLLPFARNVEKNLRLSPH